MLNDKHENFPGPNVYKLNYSLAQPSRFKVFMFLLVNKSRYW